MRFILAAVLAAFSLVACQTMRTSTEVEALEAATGRIFTGPVWGSAVAISPRIILTAAHIPTGEEAEIEFSDGSIAKVKRLWIGDPETLDIAIYEIDRDAPNVVPLSCEPLEVGQELGLIGHPYSGRWVWASLKVSSNRPFSEGDETVLVQGSLQPGMSGGPAFNDAGEVAGIGQAIFIERVMGMFGVHEIPLSLNFITPGSAICEGVPAQFLPTHQGRQRIEK